MWVGKDKEMCPLGGSPGGQRWVRVHRLARAARQGMVSFGVAHTGFVAKGWQNKGPKLDTKNII